MILSGADILVKVLIEQGADIVFGYPGGQVINIYDSLYKFQNEVTHVLAAHEQGAVHAADGYARASGKPGVVIATSGPGATNLVTGIANAAMDSIPLVAITGNVPTRQIGTDAFQEIDITGVTLPITKHNYFVQHVEKLADTLREAFVVATSGRPGPVLVDIPKDIQIAKCEFVEKEHYSLETKSAAKQSRIEEAVSIINHSKKPFIFFGGGTVASNAGEVMQKLADKIDAPIGCTFMGLSELPTDHPRFLGMQGMHGHYACSVGMSHADCIISLGTRFNDRATGNVSKFAKKAKIVQIDIDASELNKNVNVCGLCGDVKLTLEQLLPLIEERKNPEWQSEISQLKEEESTRGDFRQGMTPKNIIQMLNGYLKPETPVATDVGQHQMWAAQYLNFKKERKFISSGGLGTMGFGMGAAIGASYATGERAVLITGDGSFGMNLNELATSVSHNVPLVILLLNNKVLGMVRQWQTLFFDKHYSNTNLDDRKTDFVALAKAFGGDGCTCKNLEELKAGFDKAFASEGTFLIDARILKDEFVLPMLPPGGSVEDIIVKVGD